MEQNQLQLVEGLSESKAAVLLADFSDYFSIAEEWKKKAESIVVIEASQTKDMAMAREGRLFLAKRRNDIERKRKELKAEYLEAGRAIDRIAKALTALIEPTEDYLLAQEKFVEIREEEERARLAAIEAARVEEERIANEKAEAAAREAMKIENDRLRKEADERERVLAKERFDQDMAMKQARERENNAIIAAQKAKDDAEAEVNRQKYEAEMAIRRQKEISDAEAKKQKDEFNRIASEEKRRVENDARKAAEESQRKIDEAKALSSKGNDDAIETLKIISCELSIMADKFADTDHDHSMWLRVASINVNHVISILKK